MKGILVEYISPQTPPKKSVILYYFVFPLCVMYQFCNLSLWVYGFWFKIHRQIRNDMAQISFLNGVFLLVVSRESRATFQ